MRPVLLAAAIWLGFPSPLPVRAEGQLPAEAAEPVIARGAVSALGDKARMVTELRKGQVVGFRLIALGEGSPLARLGLQRGDIFLRIAGMQVTTPENALEAYARLQKAQRSTIEYERNGELFEQGFRLR